MDWYFFFFLDQCIYSFYTNNGGDVSFNLVGVVSTKVLYSLIEPLLADDRLSNFLVDSIKSIDAQSGFGKLSSNFTLNLVPYSTKKYL